MDHSDPLVFACNPHLVDTSAPPIPLAGAWGALYKSTTEPLINLAQGVPGAPPPADFQAKLGEAAADSATTSYGDLRGDLELRVELAKDVKSVYGTREGGKPVCEADILLTAGCNLAFYSTMIALAQASDEIILPTPWYFNHEMTLHQLGIKIVPLTCSPPSFFPSVSACRDLITSRTRAIVLVSPNNPTGAIYSDDLLREFALLAREKGVALVVDETYREFVVERPHTLFVQPEEWRSYLVHLFSFSKSYAIPGHRLGAIIASPTLLSQVFKALDCLQICPARPAQRAVTWAIEGTRKWREQTRDDLLARAKVFVNAMKSVEGLPWEVSVVGGYFAYVRHPYTGASSELVASKLGQFVGIVVLPGTFFSPPFASIDDDRYIRFSIANVSTKTLEKVPGRLSALNRMWDSLQ